MALPAFGSTRPPQAPSVPPPALVVLGESLRPFEEWFDANAARYRFLALLSPT
ncbi:MAG TPA: hypothetical protein VNM48_09225 [Chloroflexota bacterium]|nr:hypothetical protein [Chloroflexota bacterium]